LGGEDRGRSHGVFLGATDLAPEEQPDESLFQSDIAPVYVAQDDPEDRVPGDGYLLFSREGVLWTRPFDSIGLALVGDEMPLGVGSSSGEVRELAASESGMLATTAGTEVPSQLLLFDRQGNVLDELGPPARYGEIGLSPDGRYLSVSRLDAGEAPHTWIVDPERKVFSRLNPGGSTDYAPLPSADGRVAFSDDQGQIWARAANGVGEPELLLSGPTTRHANDWSRDGRYLIYDDHVPGNAQDLFVLPLEDEATPIPILETAADETYGKLSPDGRWLAYTSNDSGRYEVYVRDFRPDRSPAYGSEKLQVSMNGGDKPSWSPDGREIFFFEPDDVLHAVRVDTSPTLRARAPERLFRRRTRGYYPIAVTPGGEFVLNALSSETADRPDPITVVLNWQSLLPAVK
jgi:Tol biopolymer transport system component